jgi:hypothetical protein
MHAWSAGSVENWILSCWSATVWGRREGSREEGRFRKKEDVTKNSGSRWRHRRSEARKEEAGSVKSDKNKTNNMLTSKTTKECRRVLQL